MIRKLLPLTLAIAAAATLRLGAGGWAVVTVDALPDSFVAAAPVRLPFSVRQHGHTLLDGLQPTVTAVADKDKITAVVQPAGQSGRYVAILTFPRPAEWVITVDTGFGANSRLTLLPLPVVADARNAAGHRPPSGADSGCLWPRGVSPAIRTAWAATPRSVWRPPWCLANILMVCLRAFS